MSGVIRGNTKRGYNGRVVVNRDGSVTLHNVVLENIAVRNCDLIGESGEYPIPFADRMNVLEDWTHAKGAHPYYVSGRGGERVGEAPKRQPTENAQRAA
jgi:hypothetical protein